MNLMLILILNKLQATVKWPIKICKWLEVAVEGPMKMFKWIKSTVKRTFFMLREVMIKICKWFEVAVEGAIKMFKLMKTAVRQVMISVIKVLKTHKIKSMSSNIFMITLIPAIQVLIYLKMIAATACSWKKLQLKEWHNLAKSTTNGISSGVILL